MNQLVQFANLRSCSLRSCEKPLVSVWEGMVYEHAYILVVPTEYSYVYSVVG